MKRQMNTLSAILGFVGLVSIGCGGGVPSVQNPISNASVALFGGDSPICDVVSFKVTISGATLTPQGGGAPVSVITSANPVTVDFAALMDFSALLNLASVPAGTYRKITLTVSSPQLTALQFTGGVLTPTTLTTTLTSSTAMADIDPPLVVSPSGLAGLNLDFDIRKSVQTDSNGQVTGKVSPVFRAGATGRSDEEEGREGVGDIDELEGVVQSVSTTSSNASFVGSFVIQSGGRNFTLLVTSKTEFEGILGLTGLTAGRFVEVHAFVDSSGNIVAKEVEVEDEEEQEKAAFVGLITSVRRNTAGQVTQFNLFVRDEEPDESPCIQPRALASVSVGSTTRFNIAAMGANRAGLTFDATALGQGQLVVVHGTCQAGTPPSVAAQSVFLKLQTILGNFSSLLKVASDGKTGGFSFVPCGVVFSGSGIVTVLTFSETSFARVANLTALTTTPELAVKGLLLYETHAVTANGVSVTGSATAALPVVEAAQVHQLP